MINLVRGFFHLCLNGAFGAGLPIFLFGGGAGAFFLSFFQRSLFFFGAGAFFGAFFGALTDFDGGGGAILLCLGGGGGAASVELALTT